MRAAALGRAGIALAVLAAALPGTPAAGRQTPPEPADTVTYTLEELVVTADRAPTELGRTVSAVTLVSPTALARLPGDNLGQLLRMVPGMSTVHFDGLGWDPHMMARGFYGGGEADYVLVTLDGEPLNDFESGTIAWDLIPPVAIESAEVVRGPGSSLWGDAAVGGVVNLVSAKDAPPGGYWDLSAGEYRTLSGAGRMWHFFAGRPLRLFGNVRRTEGYRDHATRRTASAGGEIDLATSADRRLSLSAHWMWHDAELPGPLPESVAATTPRSAEPFYKYDSDEEWVTRARLHGSTRLTERTVLSGEIGADVRQGVEVRTIPLLIEFADTKERALNSRRVSGTVQLETEGLLLPWENRLVLGVDVSSGGLESEHYQVQTGDRTTYVFNRVDSLVFDAAGEASRGTAAGFAQYEVRPVPALRLSAGARVDRFSDAFEPRFTGSPTRVTTTHSAVSPRFGANLRWLETGRQTGNVYVSAGRTFKAPTPDQLFDQRTIPVPFPPFAIPISSSTLDPQRGTTLEAGAYHALLLPSDGWSAGLSLAAYRIDMEDEIDFDVATFSYGNIAESRHQGVELGVRTDGPLERSVFLNYTLQDVTSRAGSNAGNALKAIPRHVLSGGAAGTLTGTLVGGVYLTRHGSAFLDDENTARLPAFTRVDTRFSLSAFETEFSLELLNLLDKNYYSTGFLDPGGSGVALYYPAAGRVVRFGVRIGV